MTTGDRNGTPLPRLVAVDALRGIAALLVLLLHSPKLAGPLVVLKPVQAMGWSGVGLFLVLSGFSIHFRWAASDLPHHEFAQGRFARRRFFRLYPTYMAAVLLAIIVGLVVGDGFSGSAPWGFISGNQPGAVGLVAQSAVIFANVSPTPYVGVSWSLGLEVQLYAMYAVLITRLRAIGVLRVVGFALVLSIGWRLASELITTSVPVGQFLPDGHASLVSRELYAQLPSRCFEWLLGVLAAEAYFGRAKLPKLARSFLVGCGLLVLAGALFRHPLVALSLSGHPFRASDVILDELIGLAFFVLLLALIRRDERIANHRLGGLVLRALASVGLFSYSLYLTHVEMLGLGQYLLRGISAPFSLEVIAVWVFALAAAWAFYMLIERHFVAGTVDRWITAKRAARRVAATGDVL